MRRRSHGRRDVSAKALIAALALAAGATGGALIAGGGRSSRHAPDPACTMTLAPGAGAQAIAATIVRAPDGATICLTGGRYPFVHVSGATHSRYVTVRPAAGATATLAGMEVSDSSRLRFQGLHMTEGFNMHDTAGYPGSRDYQFLENTFEEPLYGIVLKGGRGPIKGVLIERNYMHRVHLERPEVDGHCSAGYAQGQDVTIFYAEGVTIARNTFREAAWHYLQGGGAGPEGVDAEHNLFEGHQMLACSHLNIWQIWDGGQNDTFKDNIAIGTGTGEVRGRSKEAATDGLIFENGPAGADCATRMQGTVIDNNLFVDAASSFAIQVYTTAGVRIEDNTVVRSQYGTGLLTERCGASTDGVMMRNVNVENTGPARAFVFSCSGGCRFDRNVSDDASAALFGAHSFKTGWEPTWITIAWNPASEATPPPGYYLARGLPFAAGYRGGGGP
jgi:hypothetical protein